MPLQSKPVECQAERLDGRICRRRSLWYQITRTSNGLTIVVAMCDEHGIIAVYVAVDGAIFFKWATDAFQRAILGLGGRKRALCIADRCTRCDAHINVGCTNHMCKSCCTHGDYDCKLSGHRVDHARPMNPVRRLKDYLWHAPPGQQDEQEDEQHQDCAGDPQAVIKKVAGGDQPLYIILDSDDEDADGELFVIAPPPPPPPVPAIAGPSRLEAGPLLSLPAPEPEPKMKVRIMCDHVWEGNPARDSGIKTYKATVLIPASRADEGLFLLSDLTPAAMTELQLTQEMLPRLLVWDKDQMAYLLAFPTERDNPEDGSFAAEVRYNAKHRMNFRLLARQDEIGLHTELLAGERFKDVNIDWHTLKLVLILVEVIHYSEGYCKGRSRTLTADCKARRRRFDVKQCTASLSDLGVEALIALELLNADLRFVDDGTYRPDGITFETPLETVPYRSAYDNHELKLTIRVHGSKIAPPKRLRLDLLDDDRVSKGNGGEEEEEEEEEGRTRKRRKTMHHRARMAMTLRRTALTTRRVAVLGLVPPPPRPAFLCLSHDPLPRRTGPRAASPRSPPRCPRPPRQHGGRRHRPRAARYARPRPARRVVVLSLAPHRAALFCLPRDPPRRGLRSRAARYARPRPARRAILGPHAAPRRPPLPIARPDALGLAPHGTRGLAPPVVVDRPDSTAGAIIGLVPHGTLGLAPPAVSSTEPRAAPRRPPLPTARPALSPPIARCTAPLSPSTVHTVRPR
ncbi:hypothetical protein AURDEDRAFT_175662 [Auricularia subglabra TFB-10046 SS5]|uniref:Uncharacterized protein n=1 Tax=Auricularia subglabra (strain TFB-10046 / SS5) TaxID=717982 RepID=J0CX59_AURST|nr:hypothetical protein AURDEDRAFT_175662 [Auricularia subglabra TFB-10046 SS5]